MNLEGTIRACQAMLGVDVDGDPQAQTWGAIARAIGVVVPAPKLDPKANPFDELAAIAESQLGTQEDTKHTNRGAAILKYQQATDLEGQGWPWCAAFVDWCLQQFLARHMEYAPLGVRRPQTAAAFGLIDWGKYNKCLVFNPQGGHPQRGDVVVYSFSHCGIVADVDVNRGTFHAIEGNSNVDGSRDGYAVVRHARDSSSVKRFIRLPVLKGAA